MLRYGVISSIQPSKGTARVHFDDDDIVSGELPILQWKTLKDKFAHSFDVGEHVACVMDEYSENGVILGAIYSQDEKPLITNADETGVTYEDGSYFKYNRADKFLDVKVGETLLQIKDKDFYLKAGQSETRAKDAGHTIKKGGESLKAILSDLVDAILAETHPTSTGPSGTPINASQYNAIKTRLNQLFEG